MRTLAAVVLVVSASVLAACGAPKPAACCAGAGAKHADAFATPVLPGGLRVSSPTTKDGVFGANEVFSGFGCTGLNKSPGLAWEGAPVTTKSYAIVAHDPDAPTGTGWYHWLVYNLPAGTTSLPMGASGALPAGAKEAFTDFGKVGYGGPCPPPGPEHRYNFTVYALDVPALELDPSTTTGALLRFQLTAHTVASGTWTGRYKR